MLKIWGRANSLNVQKAMWAVGELGLEHERIDVGGKYGGLDTADYLARNPNGLIPVLDDDGVTVWESHAILRYLAARYGAGTLWPEDPAERTQSDQWMEWAQTTLQRDFMAVFLQVWRTPPDRQNEASIKTAVETLGRTYQTLDTLLAERPFPSGGHLTFGDIPAGAQLFRFFELDIERPSLPHVEAWYARLKDRPAYAEHVMVSFAELRAW